MSINSDFLTAELAGLSELGKRWLWILGLGVLLIVLGTSALGSATLMTMATMVFVGWLLIAGGILQSVVAFSCKGWSGFFIDLLSGVFNTVVGFLIVANPAASAIALTLLIAMLLIAGGIFRIVAALSVRFPNRIWMLLHGGITLMLGISVWQQWPLSGLWVIGLFVGIDMLFNGWSLVMLGIAAKSLSAANSPTPSEPQSH